MLYADDERVLLHCRLGLTARGTVAVLNTQPLHTRQRVSHCMLGAEWQAVLLCTGFATDGLHLDPSSWLQHS